MAIPPDPLLTPLPMVRTEVMQTERAPKKSNRSKSHLQEVAKRFSVVTESYKPGNWMDSPVYHPNLVEGGERVVDLSLKMNEETSFVTECSHDADSFEKFGESREDGRSSCGLDCGSRSWGQRRKTSRRRRRESEGRIKERTPSQVSSNADVGRGESKVGVGDEESGCRGEKEVSVELMKTRRDETRLTNEETGNDDGDHDDSADQSSSPCRDYSQ